MHIFATSPLRYARSLGLRFFLQFGLHCATHQIRVILISCVVITSLFYPALDVYTSSRTSSQSIIDAWLSPTSAPLTGEHDLVDLWSGHDSLHIHKDPVTRAKCSNGNALRVERLLIQSPLVEDDGALNHKILLSTYNLEHRIQQLVSIGESPCLTRSDGQCLVMSPLAFWDYDQGALGSDANILDTLSYSRNISIAGILVTPQMVLAGRGSYEPHAGGGSKFDYATYLVLTFFFPRNACWGPASEHSHWINTVRNAVGDRGEVDAQMAEATLIALEHDPDRASTAGLSVVSAFVYLAYIGFFAYVAWSVRGMDSIHSRLGVTFTALVEIAVSTITSLSVCALVGFKITMVPWEVLPIVIVFVGAENMFNLVDAVGKTSVTLSVKQRIAEGLSHGGTSNTLKVVSYNTILGVIAFFSGGAVRQFCTFAIVVLVAHWFLAHTFFMAVLSIDVARLELEELLRHDPSLAPMMPSMLQKEDSTQGSKQPRSGWRKLIIGVKQLLKGRATTNISLLMLLGIAATLYYTTYTTSSYPSPSSLQRLGAIQNTPPSRSSTAPAYASAVHALSTTDHLWKTLNPARTSVIYLRIEQPVTVTFNRHVVPSSRASTARTIRTFKFILWLLTIMIVPIAATTGTLYGLLLYLLRNTELLEAQRNRLGTEDEDHALFSLYAKDGNDKGKTKKSLENRVSFRTLPRAFASDVELIATSKGGKMIICVGLHNEIVVWDVILRDYAVKIDAGELLLRTLGAGLGNGVSLNMMAGASSLAQPTITCVAIDEDGRYCAVGTSTGLLTAWTLEGNGKSCDVGVLRPLSLSPSEIPTSAVCDLRFVEPKKKKIVGTAKSPPMNGLGSEPSSPDSKGKKSKAKKDQKVIQLLVTYANGMVAKWMIPTDGDGSTAVYFTPHAGASIIRSLLLPTLSNGQTFAGFCLDDGRLELVETGQNEWTLFKACVLPVGNPSDLVWKVHACQTELGGILRLVVITATEAGVVSLWDGFTCECIAILDEPANGKVNQLRVSPVECETCHFCGRLPMESLSIAFSVGHVVRIEKLYVDETNMATAMSTRRCSCSRASAHLQQGQGLRRVSSTETMIGRRSRSNSNAAPPQGGSPRMSRARLSTTFESGNGTATIASFPVSGHGVHSRRASEKEGAPRRSSELLAVPPFHSSNVVVNGDSCDSTSELANSAATPVSSGYSIWSSATVAPLTEITYERGGWDASGNVYVGIRRKSKSHLKSTNATMQHSRSEDGLTSATLERWEVWCFDPGVAALRVSSLLSLAESTETEDGFKSSPPTPISPLPLGKSPPNQKTFSFVSSRTPSSSLSRSSFTRPGGSIARLPFTRVSPVIIGPLHAVAGFGNTIGVFQFTSSS